MSALFGVITLPPPSPEPKFDNAFENSDPRGLVLFPDIFRASEREKALPRVPPGLLPKAPEFTGDAQAAAPAGLSRSPDIKNRLAVLRDAR